MQKYVSLPVKVHMMCGHSMACTSSPRSLFVSLQDYNLIAADGWSIIHTWADLLT